jgi:probable rRNA maturation factor
LSIKIFYDNIKYRLSNSKKTIKVIEKVIIMESRIPGDLCFIITNDENLLEINREFLKRDTLTDVITFDYNESLAVNGEIYISYESVKRNAINYKVSLGEEMKRVMVHGILHLCGYSDKTDNEKRIMKREEDRWIKYWEEI